ncbi:MAG TPA: hypothetical protein VK907_10430 [Phnomibacter sp.]|nr:hypothetical protein [Phnomibacter sp.]
MTQRFLTYSSCFLFLIASQALGQPERFIELAEPFVCKILVRQSTQGYRTPEKGPLGKGLEIIEVTPTDRSANGNDQQYELRMVAYETGTIDLKQLAGQMGWETGTNTLTISEPPAEKVKAYAPPVEPEFSEPGFNTRSWLPFLLTAIVAGLLALYIRRRRKMAPATMARPTYNGMALLQQTKREWEQGGMNSIELGEALVNSLQTQYGIPIKRSTRQLARYLKQYDTGQLMAQTQATLVSTDAWRFGKQTASRIEGAEAINIIEHLFKATNAKGEVKA